MIRCFLQSKSIDIFLTSPRQMLCCGYSLEAPQWGASNEYPQHMFLWRNKKNIYLRHLSRSMMIVILAAIVQMPVCKRCCPSSKNLDLILYSLPLSGKLKIFFLFFPENRIWHFIHILSNGKNLYEISNPVFWKNKKNISKCHLLKIIPKSAKH